MVRTSALQNLVMPWMLGIVSLALALSTPAYPTHKNDHKVEKDGTIVLDVRSIELTQDDDDADGAELHITFAEKFPLKALQFSLNGTGIKKSLLYSIESNSRWEASAGGTHTLIIDLDDLKIDQMRLLEKLFYIAHQKGSCRFKLNTHHSPKFVKFKRVFRHWLKRKKAIVKIDKVTPAEPMTTSRSVTFHFSSNMGNTTFLCSLDGARWSRCVSPMAYSDLAIRPHTFRVRAWNRRYIRTHPAIYHWKVIEGSQSLAITKAEPAAALNNSATMKVYFEKSSSLSAQCQLDASPMTACSSPVSYENLAEGAHKITVSGFSSTGFVTSDSYAWVTDRTAPLVQWNGTPDPRTKNTTAHFSMLANEEVKWRCALNSNTFNECTSPTEFYGMAEGSNTFQAIATDAAGNSSAPLSFTWTVDSTPPSVTITSVNPNQTLTNSSTISIGFSASEPGTVSCALNDLVMRPDCASPLSFTGLPDGDYVASIVATDLAGNIGAPVEYRWTVDTSAPVLTLKMESPKTLPTSSTTAVFSITSSESASIQTFLDGREVQNNGTSVTVSELSEGDHMMVAYGMDASGNWSQHANFPWTVDLTPPSVTIGAVDPSDAMTDKTTISISFAASENAAFECERDGSGYASCQSPYIGNDLIDGQHNFNVRATDLAGNVSAPANYSWNISTYVAAQIDSQTPSGSLTNSRSMTFAFSSEKATSFLCEMDGSTPATCTSPVTYTNLSDGSHSFKVSGVNASGTVGGSDSRSWTVDGTAPVIQITSFAPSEDPTLLRNFALQFTTSETASVTCALDGGQASVCVGSYSGSNLALGTHLISLTASDAAGNSQTLTRSWTINEPPPVPPNVSFTNVTPSASVTSLNSINFSFISDRPDVSFSCRLDSGIAMPCSSPASFSLLGDGFHTFSVFATGSEGTVGPTASYSWTIDSQGPVLTFTSSFPAATNSNSFSATFALNEAGNTFCSLDNGAFYLCFSPFSVTGLSDGPHSLSVYGQDLLGNTGAIVTRSWSVDSTGPVVTMTSQSPSWSPTASGTMSISFSANETATFYCSIDGGAAGVCASPFVASGFANGMHSISVYGVDALGNVGSSVNYSWQVDTTPLAISNFNISNITSTTALITWTTNIPSSSQVMVNGTPTTLDPAYVTNHSVLLTGLARFTFYTVYAVSVDPDGRTANAGPSSFRTLR